MSIIVETPFQNFTGLDGKPLTNGKVYIGQVGTDPTVFANQIPVFWDEDLTEPAAQPLTTNAGYIVRTGTPARVYTATDYSMSVKNASGVLVYYVQKTGSFGLVSLAALASSAGASLVGWIQSGFGAILRTVQDKLRESVTPYDFGAVGDGMADDSAAIQRATNTGKAVNFLSGTFRVVTPTTYTGKVFWFSKGGAIILCDDIVLSAQSGTGSRVSGLNMMNITAPWIITRDPGNWAAVPTVVQSNGLGYQPTINDGDVWSGLTTAQQTQDIGPKIVFQGDASDIVVDDITGRFVSVLIYDAVKSTIKNCNYRGGKSFAGSAMFWNINGQAGSGNRIIDNTITYSSNSGGVMARNYDGEYSRNKISYVGESGLKTFQNDLSGVDARCRRMKISSNEVRFCYYDSIDAATNYPVDGTIDCQHQITDNDLFGSRQVGIFGDGQLCQLSGNKIRQHGKDGIRGTYNQSQISGNILVDNNKSNSAVGVHQISLEGNGNTISSNNIRTAGNLGSAIYATGINYALDNTCNDGGFYFGAVGSIGSSLFGNSDAISTMSITVPQRIRQNATNVPALELYSDVSSIPVVAMEMHPRHGELRNAIGRIEGYVSVAVDNAEYGGLIMYVASNGVLCRGAYIGTNPGIPGKAFAVLNVPNAAVTPAMLDTSSLSFWVDEAGNALKLSVKYSNGTAKTASIALT